MSSIKTPMLFGTPDYYQYLESDSWRDRVRKTHERDGYRCVICGRSNRMLETHHLTYKRLGDEQPEDLITVCDTCHRIISMVGKTLHEDSLLKDARAMEIYARQYSVAATTRAQQIILWSLLNNLDGMQDVLDGRNATVIGDYLENVVNAIDSRYSYAIDGRDLNVRGLGETVAYGTFKLGRTQRENINEFIRRDARKNLPPMPAKKTWNTL